MAHPSKPSTGQTNWDVQAGAAFDTCYDNGTAQIPKSLIDAKGDLIAGTADNTVARVGVGSNGTVLTADSTAAGGVAWAAPGTASNEQVQDAAFANATAGTGTNSLVYNDTNNRLELMSSLVTAGSGVTITGTGASGSPYVINSSGGGGGGAGYNVKTGYSAAGDGTADDTAEIQAAVDAAAATRADGTKGGVVYLPGGTYLISAPIVLAPGVSLVGDGTRSTVIYSTSTTGNAITYTAPGETNALLGSGISIQHLTIQGPTIETDHLTQPVVGTGNGINFTGNSLVGISMRDVEVRGFRGTGVYLSGPIVSILDNVRSETNGIHGIHITGATGSITSTNIHGGWARNNKQYGLFIDQVTAASNYSVISGFAADDNAYNYRVANSRAIMFNSCGSEFHGDGRAKTPEASYYVDASHQISFSNCLSLGSNSIDFQVVNSSANFLIDRCRISENTPRASKTASVNVGSGSTGTIDSLSDVSSTTTLTLPAQGVTVISLSSTTGYNISNAQVNLGDNLRIATSGKGLAYGAWNSSGNGTALLGEATLVGGTKAVTGMTNMPATALILLTRHSQGGTVGHLYYSSIVAGTGFTINSSSGSDTSVIQYLVIPIA